ncbi:MAG: response regulator transcription factor [Coriobacteriia bacterium]|nr:response regulator transcription factor [Coriobacteriia bacterium]
MSGTTRSRQETVLVVEDDPTLRMGLRATLRSAGFKVLVASTGPEGLEAAVSESPDLVLLDVMLPGMNGFEILRALRERSPDLPVIMLTAKGEEQDKVQGLRLGADDYVVKPFGIAELLARVDTNLRRRRLADAATQVLEVGVGRFDFAAHEAKREGEPVEFTALEAKLLRYLLRHEGMVLSRQQILDAVWGSDYYGTDRTVDNFINRLRAKFEPVPKAPRHLVTVRGAGYRFTRAVTIP